MRGLALGNEIVNRICYHNFFDLVGEPKPVNEELFYECCQRVLDDIKTKPCDEFYIAGGELINDLKNDPNQTVSTAFLEKVLGKRNV